MVTASMSATIRLVLSDIDGTLVPHDKVLTERSLQAVQRLHDAGIMFAVTSSRPPRGIGMYIEPLHLSTPIAAFNGGMIFERDKRILEEHDIDDEIVPTIIGILEEHKIPAWVYRGQEWYVLDAGSPHVRHEADVVKFEPIEVADFDSVSDGVAKIVGASDDPDALLRARTAIDAELGVRVSATNSSAYYLDVTNPHANKGAVVDYLSSMLGVPTDSIATIGDGHNDVSMFERSGLSIAMGNAEADVKASANEVTTSNEDEGFARAVEDFILK
jgi:Cof subfamily protein (haloacid dehalogenase superfamily)